MAPEKNYEILKIQLEFLLKEVIILTSQNLKNFL